MTKNNLVKKILNAGKKVAGKTFLYGSLITAPFLYSSNANAQVSTLNEKGSALGTKVLQKDMLNAYDIPGYVVIDKSDKDKTPIETVKVYPTFSTMRGNNELIPRIVFGTEKAQIDGKDADVFKYTSDNDTKKNIEDLFVKKGEGGGLITLSATEAQTAGFHTITTDNGTFIYFPIDSTNNLGDEMKEKIKKGKNIGVIFPADNMVIYEDINPKDRSIEYLVGMPNKLFLLNLDENDIADQALHQEGMDALDSLGRKYLSSEKAESIYLAGNLINGKANDFKNFAFLDGVQPDEEKTPSNLNGRIKLGVGYTIPAGFVGEINPQVQLGKKSFLGPYVSFSNSTKSLENLTQEDGFREVVSVPAKMYFVSTGTEVKENTKITNGLGVGLALSYLASPNLEVFVKAGAIGQKTEKTMTSSGEEYMEIDGVKDQSSVQSFNETNNFTERKMSGYVGAGVEYSPFAKKDNALKNISGYGEAGYIIGSGAMGSLGVKYNLNKSNKEKKSE